MNPLSGAMRRAAGLDESLPVDACGPDAGSVVTLREAARLAGVSQATIRGWIEVGKLSAVWIGRRRFVRPDDLLTTRGGAHLGDIVPAWRQQPRRSGWRLRCLREAAGLTQVELAERSSLTHETISLLELGRETPRAPTIIQLARALDVAPAVFTGEAQRIEPTLSVAEAAQLLAVPAARLRRWLATGKVPGSKIGGHWRLAPRDVLRLAASGRLRGASRRLDPRWRG